MLLDEQPNKTEINPLQNRSRYRQLTHIEKTIWRVSTSGKTRVSLSVLAP